MIHPLRQKVLVENLRCVAKLHGIAEGLTVETGGQWALLHVLADVHEAYIVDLVASPHLYTSELNCEFCLTNDQVYLRWSSSSEITIDEQSVRLVTKKRLVPNPSFE